MLFLSSKGRTASADSRWTLQHITHVKQQAFKDYFFTGGPSLPRGPGCPWSPLTPSLPRIPSLPAGPIGPGNPASPRTPSLPGGPYHIT